MGGFDYFITDANVMESLYSIGNTSGSMFYGACPHSMNCLSHTRCVAFGWQLGKTLSPKSNPYPLNGGRIIRPPYSYITNELSSGKQKPGRPR